MNKSLLSEEEQANFPGIESLEKLFLQMLGSAIPTKWIAYAYGYEVRSIQRWAKEKIITAEPNGLYIFGDVIKKVDHSRLDIINRQGGQPLTDERLKITTIRREISELELKKIRGELMDVEKVKRVAFSRAKLEADMLCNLPSRLKSILAAEQDEFKIGEILKEAVDQIRTQIIDKV